jgi:hypothetical protein
VSEEDISGTDVSFTIQKLDRKKVRLVRKELDKNTKSSKYVLFHPRIDIRGDVVYDIEVTADKPETMVFQNRVKKLQQNQEKAQKSYQTLTSTNPSPPGRFSNTSTHVD